MSLELVEPLSARTEENQEALSVEQSIAVKQIDDLLSEVRELSTSGCEEIPESTNISPSFRTRSQYREFRYKKSPAHKAAKIAALFFECEGFETEISRYSEYCDDSKSYRKKYIGLTIIRNQ